MLGSKQPVSYKKFYHNMHVAIQLVSGSYFSEEVL